MKTIYSKKRLFYTFFVLILGGSFLFPAGNLFASVQECPIHTIGLSIKTYQSENANEVRELQKILSQDTDVWKRGNNNYQINGVFNGATTIALYKFQVKYNLPAKTNDDLAGVIDKPTRDKLCEFWADINKANQSKQQGKQEDPVSGSLSVSTPSVTLGEAIILTVAAQDDQGVDSVYAFYQGHWHKENCGGMTSCRKVFSVRENKVGIYNYYGYIKGKKLNGTSERGWTNPKAVRVQVKSIVNSKEGNISRKWRQNEIEGRRKETENKSKNFYKEGSRVQFGPVSSNISYHRKVMSPSSQNVGNSGVPNLNTGQFSFNNPAIDVVKDSNGNYNLKCFTTNTPAGPIKITVIDSKGNAVYTGTSYNDTQGGIWLKDVNNLNLDPDKTYTVSISGGGQTGRYTFKGAALENGGQIVHNTIVNQFAGGGGYINFVSTGISADQSKLTLDLQISKVMGPAETENFKTLVIKDANGKVLKTLTGGWDTWGPILAGKKVSFDLDLAKINGPVNIELYAKDGSLLENKEIDVMPGGTTRAYTTFQSAKGWGSVYDPRINYSSQGNGVSSTIRLNWQAAGSGRIEVVDVATGKVVKLASSSGVTINDIPKGGVYYIKFYDQAGNLAHTEVIQRDSRGNYSNHEIEIPQIGYIGCGGGSFYIGGVGRDSTSQLLEVKINGQKYTLSGSQIPTDRLPEGTKVAITYQDKKTGAIFTMNYTIGKDHQAIPGEIINIKGANIPVYKKVSTSESNSGVKVTGYSDGMNPGYAKVSDYSGFTIERMSFGFSLYDNNASYKKQILENFRKYGTLPKGDYYLKDKNGNTIRIHIFQDGRVKILYDETAPKKKEEIKVSENKDTGEKKAVVPINIIENNRDDAEQQLGQDYYNDTIAKIIDKLNKDSYCKSHTCAFSKDGYTVTRNPYTGEYTIKRDKKLPRKKKKPQPSIPEKNQTKQESPTASPDNQKQQPNENNNLNENNNPEENNTPPPTKGGHHNNPFIIYKSSSNQSQRFWENFMAFILGVKNNN